ncbi:MAG: hypothetical protein Q7U04_01940, partial [Bacteriovorax sp.]|nr:hypothetical protein [Bacteriovorax sp.]
NLLITCFLVFIFSCVQNSGEAPTTSSSGTTTSAGHKAMLSSWAISNSSFFVRLDLNSANLNGSTFVLIIKYSDTSEVWCSGAYLSGDEDAGTYNTTACVSHNGGMSSSNPTTFQTGGVGSYTNDGTTLKLCPNSGSCLSFH